MASINSCKWRMAGPCRQCPAFYSNFCSPDSTGRWHIHQNFPFNFDNIDRNWPIRDRVRANCRTHRHRTELCRSRNWFAISGSGSEKNFLPEIKKCTFRTQTPNPLLRYSCRLTTALIWCRPKRCSIEVEKCEFFVRFRNVG